MQVPETISRNTIAVYAPNSTSGFRKLDGEDLFEWRKSIPDRLNEISLKNIAKHWEDNPLLDELTLKQDTRLLLDLIPTDLPLALTVDKIDDEIFWRRCYYTRWPNKLPVPKPKIDIMETSKSLLKQRNTIEINDEGSGDVAIDKSKSKPVKEIGINQEDVNNSEHRVAEKEVTINIPKTEGQVFEDTEVTQEGFSNPNGNLLTEGCNENKIDVCINMSDERNQPENSALTWKRCFLEMHVQEAIENLKPEEYNPQEIKSLVELSRNYVRSLHIKQMLAPAVDFETSDRVPLRSIICGLSLLTELKICYKQTYAGENFNWHIVQTTTNDIKNLASGLKNCNLTTFSIINSDIDCDKFITLARSLLKNTKLRTLDFSHCKISDKGMSALGRLIRESPCLESVNMTNNSITKFGAEIIAFSIGQFQNRLKKIHFDLNKIGAEGGDFLAAVLTAERCNLEMLTLPGCGLTRDNSKLVEVLKFNEKLKVLDLSNNRMGEKIFQAFSAKPGIFWKYKS